ncbi:MAG TPA: nuclear transport factor 2 family protein [Methyloceanibacter sp.]|nr:nuclear transport factor 2 family protein [Methyloceanibacter sp.]
MRTTALLVFVFCLAANLPQARAGEAETIAAINAAAAALDNAFERQSADEIKHMMTADHIAVTPYYDAPQTVAEQIASLPELKYEQTNIGAVKVDVLGPDAGMRTFTARLDGTYKGKPIPSPAFVTAIMVRQDGQWKERFYQVTAVQH